MWFTRQSQQCLQHKFNIFIQTPCGAHQRGNCKQKYATLDELHELRVNTHYPTFRTVTLPQPVSREILHQFRNAYMYSFCYCKSFPGVEFVLWIFLTNSVLFRVTELHLKHLSLNEHHREFRSWGHLCSDRGFNIKFITLFQPVPLKYLQKKTHQYNTLIKTS